MKTNLSKYQVIFLHLAFWGFILALPFLLQPSNPTTPVPNIPKPVMPPVKISITVFFAAFTLLNIPFFYINSDFLIPKILKDKGIWWYFASVIVLIAALLGLATILNSLFFQARFFPRTGFTFQMLFFLAMSSSYRIIYDTFKQGEVKKERENERLKSELSFLRSQISPHFMFNVLNSIVSLSRRKPERVEPVIVKLSDLMRYMLYESDDAKVTLAREAQYLRAYIELQQLRFGDDIDINFEVATLSASQAIEPMLLIPFVENAFKHGVGMIMNPTIDISLSADETLLSFEVINKVNRQYQEIKDDASGIGLNNVKRRLELLYPDNHQLIIKEEADFYKISLTITRK